MEFHGTGDSSKFAVIPELVDYIYPILEEKLDAKANLFISRRKELVKEVELNTQLSKKKGWAFYAPSVDEQRHATTEDDFFDF
jgi:hypothetical protein